MLPIPPNISEIRREYRANTLLEGKVCLNPLAQFDIWLQEALKSDMLEPTAMFVATADKNGALSLRTVLLKGLSELGFVFYTNYLSRKGRQIIDNPQVALLFYWDILERQVRIEGTAQMVSAEQSDNYFHSRPKGSQIGAIASAQSTVIASREVLEQQVADVIQQYEHTDDLERPPHWGGYVVRPTLMEFWQGRSSRLHDRIQYRLLDDQTWCIERLSP